MKNSFKNMKSGYIYDRYCVKLINKSYQNTYNKQITAKAIKLETGKYSYADSKMCEKLTLKPL